MQALSVLLLVVASSLSNAQLLPDNRSRGASDQLLDPTLDSAAVAEMLSVLTSTLLLPKPLTTPKPKVIAERSLGLLHVDPLGPDTCGFFILPRDGVTRTRVCGDSSASCAPFGSYLGCGIKPHTICFNGTEPACAPSARIGDQTLCCPKTRNLDGECQTFIRDDGALGNKTLLGCREADIAWDPTVSLKTATEDFSTTSTKVATSALPVSSTLPEDALAPSTQALSASSTASPALVPSTDERDSTHPHTGVIIGGVLGGLGILGTVACVTVWLVVRRRQASGSNCGAEATHELSGDQPCVPQNVTAEVEFAHKASSPVRASCEVHQAASYDAVGSPVKPAELG
ncbi:hypothetical protein LX32DRAFT_715481 [Colletotrichum zoysiae]|uniref:Uncharacterized protein n=1 Tax=Colletotrichum zoysiae TaxID=1216348 RepID=A0AAD9M6Q9_9PEZI|nr:hypothetical protein LX32DRAFT_715481 [Colletotrichum zoysiae]